MRLLLPNSLSPVMGSPASCDVSISVNLDAGVADLHITDSAGGYQQLVGISINSASSAPGTTLLQQIRDAVCGSVLAGFAWTAVGTPDAPLTVTIDYSSVDPSTVPS